MSEDSDLTNALATLAELETQIAALQALRESVRALISEIVAVRYDNRVAVPGVGTLTIRRPSVAKTWDGGALTELAQSLREQGQEELAAEIEGCRKEVMRAGGLTIVPERKEQ